MASITSSELPIASPKGWLMSPTTAATRRPLPRPILTINSARAIASASVFIRAPRPVLTSSTITLAPAAIFLLMIELAISGTESTVAVTSRSAYNLPSAGARSRDCPLTTR